MDASLPSCQFGSHAIELVGVTEMFGLKTMPFNLYVLSIKVEVIVDALGRLVNVLNSNKVNCLPE